MPTVNLEWLQPEPNRIATNSIYYPKVVWISDPKVELKFGGQLILKLSAPSPVVACCEYFALDSERGVRRRIDGYLRSRWAI